MQLKAGLDLGKARMQLLLSLGLTLLTIVPALCWPIDDDNDVKLPYAFANAYPEMQNYPERQKYVDEQNDPLFGYYAGNHNCSLAITTS